MSSEDLRSLVLLLAFIAAITGAVAAGAIADDRGRSSLNWMVLGFLLPIVAPFYVALMPRGMVRMQVCDYCAETVRDLAVICRYCGRELVSDAPSSESEDIGAEA